MKLFLIGLLVLGSLSTYACSCSEEPVGSHDAAIDLLEAGYTGVKRSNVLEVTTVKHHTTFLEKIDYKLSGDNSCNGRDENGDVWVMCMPKYIDTILVSLKNCSIKMRVITKIKKAKAKVLNSSCVNIVKDQKFSIRY
jgi:hypothetical protein